MSRLANCGTSQHKRIYKELKDIEKIIDKNYSMVLESDGVERLNDIFTGNKVAFVMEGGKIKYILTKIDLIAFLSFQSVV